MHLAPDQPDISPLLPLPAPEDAEKLPAVSNTRKDSAIDSVIEGTAKELGVKAISKTEEVVNQIIPYSVQMEERSYPWIEKDTPYGLQHKLQNFDICLPRPLEESPVDSTVWVFFLHGGAWRDPLQDKSEIHPALSQLLSPTASPASKHALQHIAGIVSLNYGLSSHVDDETADPSFRNVHPKHISDLVVALGYFQRKYSVGIGLPSSQGHAKGYDYILAGHSAGATLAFQSWVLRCPCATYRPARAVIGLAGIYDLPLVVATHASVPFYRKMITDAFGADERVWRDASPVERDYREMAKEGGTEVVVLGYSDGDELVENEQCEDMQAELQRQGWILVESEGKRPLAEGNGRRKELLVLRLEGGHDEMWEKGEGVRRGIEVAVGRLFMP